MQNFANIEIAFIHRKAPLPSDFSYPEMPGGLTEKTGAKMAKPPSRLFSADGIV